jgi:NADH-quinone oxidoreductase subunit C
VSDQPVGQPSGAPELSGVQAETGETSGTELVGAGGKPSTPRPYGGYFDTIADSLARAYPNVSTAVERVVVDRGQLTLHVRREHLADLAQRLRDDDELRFELLASLSGVHYPMDRDAELHVVYELRSMTHNRHLRLEVSAPDAEPRVPSVVGVWPTADFHEREAWDLFGIVFDGHPALTRIMMPDDWPGHPQRKDYPLGGIPVEYKGASVPPPEERRQYA